MTSDVQAAEATDQVGAALADRDCCAILTAAAFEAVSIPELMERCDVPSTAVYRKLDLLVDAGLLREETLQDGDGSRESAYATRRENIEVTIDLAGRGGFTVSFSLTDGDRAPTPTI